MELNYNVKGDRRKQLVKALEEMLGVKSKQDKGTGISSRRIVSLVS